MLQDFPDELILEILSNLPVPDIVNSAQYVCERWNFLCKSPIVWKGKEHKIMGRNNIHEVVEIAKLAPLTTALSIGKSHEFIATFTGSHLYITSYISSQELKDIVRNLKLKSISVPRSIFEQCSKDLIHEYAKIESLTIISDMYCTETKHFRALVERGLLSHLKSLTFYGATNITSDTIALLCQSAENLEELCIHQGDDLTSDAFQNLNKCSKLRNLQITDSSSLDDLAFLGNCPSITELDLSQCNSLKSSALRHLLSLTNLKRFHMRNSRVRGLPLLEMSEKLKKLELIDLFYSSGYRGDDLRAVKKFLPHIIICEGHFDFEKY